MNSTKSEFVNLDGTTMPAHFAARLIVSNIHRKCHVEFNGGGEIVKCPVWPTVVRESSGLDLVRWLDASGSVRAMARV